MNRYYDFIVGLWPSLELLFQENAIISHKFVFEELNPKTVKQPDFLAKWIKDKERFFFPVTEKQTELVKDILSRFPGLIDHEKEINEADPWLIALVLEKRETVDMFKDFSTLTIVSAESEKSAIKIPAVCKAFKIPHMNLREFFVDNNWKFRLEKV